MYTNAQEKVLHYVPLGQFTLLLGHWFCCRQLGFLGHSQHLQGALMAPHLRLLGSPSCSFLSPFAQSGCSALLSATYGSLPTSSHSPLLACTHRTRYSFPPATAMAPYTCVVRLAYFPTIVLGPTLFHWFHLELSFPEMIAGGESFPFKRKCSLTLRSVV